MRPFQVLVIALPALAATGCTTVRLPVPQPSFQTLNTLRNSDLPAMQVGTFGPGPDFSAAADKSITIRAEVLEPPDGESLSKYLGKLLQADLKSADKLDDNSPLEVRGLFTASDVDCGFRTGDASLAAKVSLFKQGRQIFEKEVSVSDRWESSILADIAIPEAVNHYTGLYDKLVYKLLTDPDFKAAARAP